MVDVYVKVPERPSPYAVACPTCGAPPAVRCRTRWTKCSAPPHRTRVSLAASSTPRGPAPAKEE